MPKDRKKITAHIKRDILPHWNIKTGPRIVPHKSGRFYDNKYHRVISAKQLEILTARHMRHNAEQSAIRNMKAGKEKPYGWNSTFCRAIIREHRRRQLSVLTPEMKRTFRREKGFIPHVLPRWWFKPKGRVPPAFDSKKRGARARTDEIKRIARVARERRAEEKQRRKGRREPEYKYSGMTGGTDGGDEGDYEAGEYYEDYSDMYDGDLYDDDYDEY